MPQKRAKNERKNRNRFIDTRKRAHREFSDVNRNAETFHVLTLGNRRS